ncbi:hypothetical protein BJF82_04870 [Kytococcus sp. CUA-901]|nr:hypothetical protein BJF82_04870 [Kytococcus sp. CUA-901]
MAYAVCASPQMHLLRRTDPASIIGLLYTHAVSGWTAPALVDALNEAAAQRHIDPRWPAHHPHALLRHLLGDIDPDPLVHTHGPEVLWRCQRTDCDGHGWLHAGPREPVRKCPDCHPMIRQNHL